MGKTLVLVEVEPLLGVGGLGAVGLFKAEGCLESSDAGNVACLFVSARIKRERASRQQISEEQENNRFAAFW
jgi:hypothetical protein